MLNIPPFTYGSFPMKDGSALVIASRNFSGTVSFFVDIILSFSLSFFLSFFLFLFCKILTTCCLSYVLSFVLIIYISLRCVLRLCNLKYIGMRKYLFVSDI